MCNFNKFNIKTYIFLYIIRYICILYVNKQKYNYGLIFLKLNQLEF